MYKENYNTGLEDDSTENYKGLASKEVTGNKWQDEN